MKKMKWTTWGGCLLLAVAFLVLCVFQNHYMDAMLSSDDASEMILAKLLSENGGILSSQWYYSTEIRVLNAQLIWSILFRFIGSWHVVHLLGNIICFGISLVCLWVLCRAFRMQKVFPILGAFLLIPVSDLYYAFVLQNVCYIPYIATIFVMFAGLVYFVDKSSGKRAKVIMGLIIALSVINGMGGARQLLTFYLPFVAAVILYLCFWAEDTPKENRHIGSYMLLSFLGAAAGYMINSRILSRRYFFAQYGEIRYSSFSWNRVIEVINGWLNTLGYKSGGKLFSITTLFNVTAGITILLAVYSIVRILKDRSVRWQIRLFALYYAAAFAAYILLYSMTDMDYSDRYNLPVTACSYVLIFAYFSDRAKNNGKERRRIITGLTLFTVLLIGCGIFNYYPRVRGYNGNPRKDAVIAAVDNGYTCGYATFWNANISTELSDGKLEMWAWTDYPEDITELNAFPQWLRKVSHDTPPQQKVCVLLSAEEAQKFSFVGRIGAEHLVYESDAYVVYGFESVEELREVVEE
ncbi:MAG: hypothetical protein MR016_10780 [Agathobacter sp.]|nr:hypothetical protein [Agathobacter sp.]